MHPVSPKHHGHHAPPPSHYSRPPALVLQLVFVKPDFKKYTAASAQAFAVLRSYDERVQGASLDEAYLDATQYCATHGVTGEQVGVRVGAEGRPCVLTEGLFLSEAGIVWSEAGIVWDYGKAESFAAQSQHGICRSPMWLTSCRPQWRLSVVVWSSEWVVQRGNQISDNTLWNGDRVVSADVQVGT
jgi:hypothetical protein